MFGLVDMILTAIISGFGCSFICLFILGASTIEREEKAYKEGYDKGYADGKKVGGENDV